MHLVPVIFATKTDISLVRRETTKKSCAKSNFYVNSNKCLYLGNPHIKLACESDYHLSGLNYQWRY